MDNEYQEFTGKTLEDAVIEAATKIGTTTSNLQYEVVTRGTSGFLGIGAKPFVIKAKGKKSIDEEIDQILSGNVPEKKIEKKTEKSKEKVSKKKFEETPDFEDSFEEKKKDFVPADPAIAGEAKEYLEKILNAMEVENTITSVLEENNVLSMDVEGPDMGLIIGKRGQTLDSLQYLVSLYVNKKSEGYVRVKLDTENYRDRRKETLETLAKNISYKVKRTRRPYKLEPMNPYERRIIHSALQGDKFVTTKSEGEEPYRRVVVFPKKYNGGNRKYGHGGYSHGGYTNHYDDSEKTTSEE